MNNIKEIILNKAEEYFDEVREIRRHLHAHPELGFDEYHTAEFIASKLTEYKISFKTGIAQTGIVGLIEGKNHSSRVLALRTDMDALPIDEQNNVPYKSQTAGVMHACGHDVHMACLLGAAKILFSLKNEFEGSVKLIFQPSEEMFPGGALAMINEGVLDNPKVDMMIGQHVYPVLESGMVGFKPGIYLASTDEIYITVKGKGGHAATPELVINPINIAARVLLELEKEFNHSKPQDSPSVLAFGKITGNGRTNIIPDEVKLEGTIRTFNEKWRAEAHSLITEIANKIAGSLGGSCNVFIDKGYPFLVNDEDLTKKVIGFSKDFLGEENVHPLELRMTSEDFAYYSQQIPSVFYRLGVKQKQTTEIRNLHTSTFDVDESALKTGMSTMAWISLQCLA
jgi:amidohydrolase